MIRLYRIQFLLVPKGTTEQERGLGDWRWRKAFAYTGSLDRLVHELKTTYGDRVQELSITDDDETLKEEEPPTEVTAVDPPPVPDPPAASQKSDSSFDDDIPF